VTGSARREELKNFLRSRRERLSPSEFGFAEGTRRRTPGLRRDEVALLANIGTTTYTFLEQGRDINVSSSVLERLSDVLRLSPQEKHHLFSLAIGDLPDPALQSVPLSLHLENLLHYLNPCAAVVLNHRFDLIAFNRSAKLLFMYSDDALGHWNVLEKDLLDGVQGGLFVNYETYLRSLVANFRISFARYADDPEMIALQKRLEGKSELFRKLWSEYRVLSGEDLVEPLRLMHPKLGELEGQFNIFSVFGYRDYTLNVFTPTNNSDSAKKIEQALKFQDEGLLMK
jgi:hypothetical protein